MTSTSLQWLPWGSFLKATDVETKEEIGHWWQARRLTFNLWLFAIGLLTWLSVLIAGSGAVKPGVDFEEPFAMILGPPLYALAANVCFTAGPLFDAIFYKGRPRPRLGLVGFWFSVLLTAAPGLWAIFCWVRAVKTGILMD